jgi:hypothetical protein
MIRRTLNHGLNGFPDHEIFLTSRVRKSAHCAVIRLDREKHFVLKLQMGRLFFHNLKRHNALGTLIEQLHLLGNGKGRTGKRQYLLCNSGTGTSRFHRSSESVETYSEQQIVLTEPLRTPSPFVGLVRAPCWFWYRDLLHAKLD